MRPVLLLGLLLFSPFVVVADAVADDGETVRSSKHFRVICHFEAGNLADEALETLEVLWPLGARLYGLGKRGPAKPLAVHLYRNRRDYEAAEQRLIGGSLKRNLAFAHYGSQSAHVAVQPDASDSTLRALGLPYLTRLMLAHETAHLIRFFALANYRHHTGWFKDGTALWLKHRTVEAMHLSDGLEHDPVSATSIRRVQRLLTKGKLPSVEKILEDDLKGLAFYERYDVKGLFFEFLARPPRARILPDLVTDLGRMKADSTLAAALAGSVRKRLGSAASAGLDEAFHGFLQDLRPIWEESIRSLETAGLEWEQMGLDDTNAVAWRTAPLHTNRYAFSAGLQVLAGSNPQMNVLLDRTANGFVSVAFTAGWGVTLFLYDSGTNKWAKVAAAECDRLPIGRMVDLLIEVDGTAIRVSIAGELVLESDLPGRQMDGPWGLGAEHDSAGIWSHVVVKPKARAEKAAR